MCVVTSEGVYLVISLVPRPRPKIRERGLVALPCIFSLMYTSSNVCYGRTRLTSTVEVSWLSCKRVQDEARASWISDAVVCYLPHLSIACTLSIHKFRQIVSVDLDPSQCRQVIGEFVSITHMGKQRSPISIVHRSPANVTPLPHICRLHRRRHHELLYHIA